MIDNIVYEEISGIRVAFIHKKDYNIKQAMICFNYGSGHNNIIMHNKNVEFPPGIAHFLEHKMFEDKERDMFERFNKLGGTVNAFTNVHSTVYYFDCIENYYDCFDELMHLVSCAYFTEENVQKEKEIIEQEIKMYDDNPYWRVFFNLMRIMYGQDNPISKDIAGSVSDIQKIDENMLYSCYKNFYTKDNAIIICCGDINREFIKKSISKSLNIGSKRLSEIQKYKENMIIKNKKIEQKMEINQTIFNIAFKNIDETTKIEKKLISGKILLDLIFGLASSFYEKMHKMNLIDNTFGFDFNSYDGASFYLFNGSGKNSSNIINAIKNEIEYFIKNGINKEDFERIKNKHIGKFISSFNVIDNICMMESDFFCKRVNIQKYYDELINIDINSVENNLKAFEMEAYISLIN